jgi:hypothetical protein
MKNGYSVHHQQIYGGQTHSQSRDYDSDYSQGNRSISFTIVSEMRIRVWKSMKSLLETLMFISFG